MWFIYPILILQEPITMLQMQSTVRADGHLELAVVDVPQPEPGADEVVIRVEAAPINPSDLGLLLGGADPTGAQALAEGSAVRLKLPPEASALMAARMNRPMPCGNEGAGVVVAAGESDAAQALLGKTVATWRGAMYSQFKLSHADQCLVLQEGTTPAEAASCFVNPLTVLGMVGTMRLEGHTALVHTAAASNLGQMLQKVCTAEGIDLVNIVRRPQHVELLRGIGAKHVVDSSLDSFGADLVETLTETGATLAFDATGGGDLPGRILAAMETAQTRLGSATTPYGSAVHKQLYIYGGLQRGPTVFDRAFGMAWGMGGWLLPIYLDRVGPEESGRMRQRVADEIKTTFASSYGKTVSLAEAVTPEAISRYGRISTGEKYLIEPQR